MGGDVVAHVNLDGDVLIHNEYMNSESLTIAVYKAWSNFLVKTIKELRKPKIEVLTIVDPYAGVTREYRWGVSFPSFREVQFGYEPDYKSAQQAANDWIDESKAASGNA